MFYLIITFGLTVFMLLNLIVGLTQSHSTKKWDGETLLIGCIVTAVLSSICLKLLLGMVLTPTP